MTQTLFENIRFHGSTFVEHLDAARLKGQLGRVYTAMQSQRWMTLRELSTETGDPEASCSARIRQLRQWFTVDRRRRGEPSAGIWEYRLVSSRGEKTTASSDCAGPKASVTAR